MLAQLENDYLPLSYVVSSSVIGPSLTGVEFSENRQRFKLFQRSIGLARAAPAFRIL